MNELTELEFLRANVIRDYVMTGVVQRFGDVLEPSPFAPYAAAMGSEGPGFPVDEDGVEYEFWLAGMAAGSAPILSE